MIKYLIACFTVVSFLTSCVDDTSDFDQNSPCPAIACTEEFRSLTVKVENAAGDTVSLKAFTVKNLRTGQTINNASYRDIHNSSQRLVITDAAVKGLTTTGDTLLVTAISKTDEIKTARFVVSGGQCACHISKVSGPEKILF